VRRLTGPAAALLTAALLAMPAASAVAKPKMTSYRCPDTAGFTCHRIDVPLDRTGAVPGTISLRFATERGEKLRKKVLVALAGGPGQPDVVFGPSFADGFAPELNNRSIVVVDQRGTGGSHALSCPELQGMDQLSAVFPQDTAACADRLGEQRNSFGSIESAEDLEAVREALGVEKLSIYGVSYGTWVAQQYARIHPDRVEKLILDSVVPPGSDPWDTRITKSLPRVLRGLCARRPATGSPATSSPTSRPSCSASRPPGTVSSRR
jgi:pimeloyl-ACP methyl ester carboxylesterase